MGKEGYFWLDVKIRHWGRWRRFSMILTVVFLLICLLRNHIGSGDLYYAVETAQNTYINVDEVLEDVVQNWRGLQKNDVSFSIKVAKRLLTYPVL
jgi:hypothetical protein